MKAHKRIIILTFWLSVIFAIATIVFYILGIKSAADVNIDKWFNICLSFTTGLIVPCLIEIGNYTSVKHKLYEKLFSECLSFNNILTRERAEMMEIMNMIDSNNINCDFNMIANKLNILNDGYIQKLEQFTRHNDFSFVTSSDKRIKGKKMTAVANSVNCINKLIYITSQHIVISRYLLAKDLNSTYIECFNTFQTICSIKSELDNCVHGMEQIHRFSITWDNAKLLNYSQDEDSYINKMFSIYKNNANRRFQTNQAFTLATDLAQQFPIMQQQNDNKEKDKNKGKQKKPNNK